jgi:hypothetical protein
MLSGLCLSNGITLVLGLEHVGWSLFVRDYTHVALLVALEYGGWSLFVRQYTFIPRTLVC